MTDELKAKLSRDIKHLLEKFDVDDPDRDYAVNLDFLVADLLPMIDDAYRDAGYRPYAEIHFHKSDNWIKEMGMMTGPEFYNRFMRLVEAAEADVAGRIGLVMADPLFAGKDKPTAHLTKEGYLAIARRAAGIEEEQ